MNILITFILTYIEVVISLVIGHAACTYSPSCSQQDAQQNTQTICSNPLTEITTVGYVSFSQTKASAPLSADRADACHASPHQQPKVHGYEQFIFLIPLNDIRVWESKSIGSEILSPYCLVCFWLWF
jgi:hypothetical protein